MVGSVNQMGLSTKTRAREQGRVGLALVLPKKNISKVKSYNCNKLGHFARDCTELKKVSHSLDLSSIYVCYPSSIFVCSHIFVAVSLKVLIPINWLINPRIFM